MLLFSLLNKNLTLYFDKINYFLILTATENQAYSITPIIPLQILLTKCVLPSYAALTSGV